MVFNFSDIKDRNSVPIEKTQNVLLGMMKTLHEFCVVHDIKYSLAFGSLLGAVRHKGFIPWDDDMDIIMTRTEFEKFMRLSGNLEGLQVCTYRNVPDWPYAMCKVVDPSTVCIEKVNSSRCMISGLFIDIFVYDEASPNGLVRKIEKKKTHIYSVIFDAVQAGGSESSKLRNMTCGLFSHLYSLEKLNRKLDRILIKHPDYSSSLMCPVYAPNRVPEFDKSLLENVKLYEYCDTEFYGVVDSDFMLKYYYGNYMRVPDKENQIQHSFMYLDFDYPYQKYIEDHSLESISI